MELLRDILIQALQFGEIKVSFGEGNLDIAQIVEGKCYQALNKIKAVIEDDSLADDVCFMKIEEVICILEEIGSSGGIRHDFG